MDTGGSPLEEILAALTSLAAGVGSVLGFQRYQKSKEDKSKDDSRKPSSERTGAHTVRLETANEKIHKLDQRITRQGQLLFDKLEALEHRASRIEAIDEKLEMVLARVIEVEDLKAKVAVIEALIERLEARLDRSST